MSFVLYIGGGRGSFRPDQRITSIDNEPVEYYETDSSWSYVFPKCSHKIPTDRVKSIGSKLVEYSSYSRQMIRIGDEPIKYSFWGNLAWIGDKEVKCSWWSNRITSIGDKPVQYSAYPKDPFEKWNILIPVTITVGIIAIIFFVNK